MNSQPKTPAPILEILRSLKIGTGNLQYALEILEREGKVTTIRVGSYKHFYSSVVDEEKERIRAYFLKNHHERYCFSFLASLALVRQILPQK